MATYKMLCLDIDGTLLNSKHEISPENLSAIQRLQSQTNVIIVLASGRAPHGMFFLANELGLNTPVIAYSGAIIVDNYHSSPEQLNILLDQRLTLEVVAKFERLCRNLSVNLNFFEGYNWFALRFDEWVTHEQHISRMDPKITQLPFLFERWRDGIVLPNKIICMGIEYEIDILKQGMEGYNGKLVGLFRSKPEYLEVSPPKVNKAMAIKWLAEKLNIKMDEIVAVGDSYNDLEMVTEVGLGIAMENAVAPVIAAAKWKTTNNNRNGVANAINYAFGI